MSFLLSFLIFFPIAIGLASLFFFDDDEAGSARWGALVAAGLNAGASLLLLANGVKVPGGLALQGFEEKHNWIEPLGIQYLLRVDGMSTFLIILATVATFVAIAASWNSVKARAHVYYGCILLLSGGMIGVLAAMDLFLFYVFWEIMLIPAFFLVGLFGGENRRPAVIKFVIYTMVGSLLMLIGIMFVGYQHFHLKGSWTFALDALYGLPFQDGPAMWAFLTFVAAFGVKAALFPLHTWVPSAYSEAPMPVTFLLSAVMAKLGIYGLLRVALPLFPEAATTAMPILAALAVTGVVYAAFVALAQTDARLLVAYASVSHLGVILLGVFSLNQQAVAGSIFHMVGHAVSTGALFLFVGMMIERRGSPLIADWGGAATKAPMLATAFMLFMLASVGLPGLATFIGEFMIFLGAFGEHRIATAVALTTIIFGAAYMLWFYQRTMFGPVTHKEVAGMRDLDLREHAMLVPLTAAIIVLGVFPQPMVRAIAPAAEAHLKHFEIKADPAPAHSPTELKPPGHAGHGAAAHAETDTHSGADGAAVTTGEHR